MQKVLDLGQLTGRVLLFGGPYANLHATEALRKRATQMAIPDGNVICTGDVVAYCADPVATVRAVRDWAIPVVAGNCEIQLAAHALDCGCGFEAGTTCDLLSAGWYAHANAQVDDDMRTWMGACPDVVCFVHAGLRYAVIHGGATDVARFLWPVSPDAAFAEEIAVLHQKIGPVDRIIAGHSGIAFVRKVAGVTWINAGVIGMPPNAKARATEYVTLNETGDIALHMLSYDAAAAHEAMIKAGLTQGYHMALLSGVWPSQDVLPPEMRQSS